MQSRNRNHDSNPLYQSISSNRRLPLRHNRRRNLVDRRTRLAVLLMWGQMAIQMFGVFGSGELRGFVACGERVEGPEQGT